MAVTYDPACSADKDKVRALIGDTTAYDPTPDESLDDQEITFALTKSGSEIYAAASFACRMLRAKLARFCDVKATDYSEAFSQRAKQLAELQKDLDRQALLGGTEVSAGGIEVSDFETADEDTTLVQPSFKVGMTDNPEGTEQDADITSS